MQQSQGGENTFLKWLSQTSQDVAGLYLEKELGSVRRDIERVDNEVVIDSTVNAQTTAAFDQDLEKQRNDLLKIGGAALLVVVLLFVKK